MLKKYLPKIIITSVIVLLPMLFGLIMWNKLPLHMVTHWNASGVSDSWSPKEFVVFGIPLFMLVVHLICIVATLIDPKRRNVDGKPFGMLLWLCPAMSILTNAVTYGYTLREGKIGYHINMNVVIMLLVAIMLIALGNYMPKCGQNYTMGIRTPWALNDPKNWTATHRFGGRVYVIAGILLVPMSLLAGISASTFWIVFGVVMVAAFLPMLYSYLYYRKHGNAEEEIEE